MVNVKLIENREELKDVLRNHLFVAFVNEFDNEFHKFFDDYKIVNEVNKIIVVNTSQKAIIFENEINNNLKDVVYYITDECKKALYLTYLQEKVIDEFNRTQNYVITDYYWKNGKPMLELDHRNKGCIIHATLKDWLINIYEAYYEFMDDELHCKDIHYALCYAEMIVDVLKAIKEYEEEYE